MGCGEVNSRAFTWWCDKNSTRLWAGQVVSISSERRDLNRKSPRNFIHCTAGTQCEGDGHGGEEKSVALPPMTSHGNSIPCILTLGCIPAGTRMSDLACWDWSIEGQIITLGGIKSKKHETTWGSYLPEQLAHLGQGQKGIQGKETCDVPKKFIGKSPDEASVPSWGDQGSSVRNLGRRTKCQIMILTIFALQRQGG
ncbi:hypothetical protein EDD17DRAFT_1507671 [Pisolithus thermaeus]|nr:hypothetical protein EDD17DRAFT_1507671 [Pisolithus thermaeus]